MLAEPPWGDAVYEPSAITPPWKIVSAEGGARLGACDIVEHFERGGRNAARPVGRMLRQGVTLMR